MRYCTRSKIPRPADGIHIVKQGEWLSKIAMMYGYFANWNKIWDDPNNKEIRNNRKSPNILYPGDEIFIPELEIIEKSCGTDAKHKFVISSAKKYLKIKVLDWENKPRINITCKLVVDGEVVESVQKTNSDGFVEAEIDESSCEGQLYLGEDQSESYELKFGHLDPIDEVAGYQQRLFHLGYYQGKIDGVVGPLTKHAIMLFQEHEDLDVTGEIQDETKKRLIEKHGS